MIVFLPFLIVLYPLAIITEGMLRVLRFLSDGLYDWFDFFDKRGKK